MVSEHWRMGVNKHRDRVQRHASAPDPLLKPSVTFLCYLASLCLSFPKCKMGMPLSASLGCCEGEE